MSYLHDYDPTWDKLRQKQIEMDRKVQETNEQKLQDYRSEYGTHEKADAVEKNQRYYKKKSATEMVTKSRASTAKMRRRGKHSFTDKKGNVFRVTYKKKFKKNSSSPDASPVIDHISMRPVGEHYLKIINPNKLEKIDKSIRKELPKIIKKLKQEDLDFFRYEPPLAPGSFHPEGGVEYLKAKQRFESVPLV